MNNELLSPELVAEAFHAFRDVDAAITKFKSLHVALITVGQMEQVLIDLQRAVCHVAESAGFQPVDLTKSVHNGYSQIRRF